MRWWAWLKKFYADLWKRYRPVPCECGGMYPDPSCEHCAGTGERYEEIT